MPLLLSVITPCLNAELTIRDTIESVLKQNYKPFEYIVIDGGSDDNTLAILNEYKDQIDILISEPDQGISDAFNKGINLASGDYTVIINADDYFEPNIFEHILSLAEQNQYPGVIHGSLQYIADDGLAYTEHPDIQRIWHYMSIFHPTMFIHRSAYQAIGSYRLDFNYAMDSEWVHRAIANEIAFMRIHETVSSMRLGGASHKYMYRSLSEFRRSSISHGASWIVATYYFCRQLMIQKLIDIRWIKRLALWRRNN